MAATVKTTAKKPAAARKKAVKRKKVAARKVSSAVKKKTPIEQKLPTPRKATAEPPLMKALRAEHRHMATVMQLFSEQLKAIEGGE